MRTWSSSAGSRPERVLTRPEPPIQFLGPHILRQRRGIVAGVTNLSLGHLGAPITRGRQWDADWDRVVEYPPEHPGADAGRLEREG
jgi:hypothetical protein